MKASVRNIIFIILITYSIQKEFQRRFIDCKGNNKNSDCKGEEVASYAYKGYDCDSFWKSDTLCIYGIQPYVVECHYRSNLRNFPTKYKDMLEKGKKISFDEVKNGDLILFKKGSFGLKECFGIYKDGFIYYKTAIAPAKRNEIKDLENDIEAIRRYW